MPQTWWSTNISDFRSYIRSYGEGVGWPSRKWFSAHLKPGVSLLDIGCGSGCELENLLADGRDDIGYEGCDYTPEAVAACRELFPEVKFFEADARKLELPDSSRDVVLLRHTLDHIDKWQDAVKEAYRVARKEVVIILWVPLMEGDQQVYKEHGSDAYYRVFNRKMLEEEFGKLPGAAWTFEEISCKGVPGREYRVDTAITITKTTCVLSS